MDIIVDVDGTLACCKHRAHWLDGPRPNWKAFMNPAAIALDKPITPVINLIKTYEEWRNIIIVSARNERHRSVTQKWLEDKNVPFERLYLRGDDDYRPDDVVKKEILQQIKADGYQPSIVFDDRLSVCKMWAQEGLFVFCVNQGLIDF